MICERCGSNTVVEKVMIHRVWEYNEDEQKLVCTDPYGENFQETYNYKCAQCGKYIRIKKIEKLSTK